MAKHINWPTLVAYPAQLAPLQPGQSALLVCPKAQRSQLGYLCSRWAEDNTDWAAAFSRRTEFRRVFWTRNTPQGVLAQRATLPGQRPGLLARRPPDFVFEPPRPDNGADTGPGPAPDLGSLGYDVPTCLSQLKPGDIATFHCHPALRDAVIDMCRDWISGPDGWGEAAQMQRLKFGTHLKRAAGAADTGNWTHHTFKAPPKA